MKIYYIYEKTTGKYAGSGTPKIDNETHSYTEVPVISYGENDPLPVWDGAKWVEG